MKIHPIPAAELTPDLEARWREIQETNPDLANPYFCVEFFQAVADVRDDVWVGVLEENDRVVGFFPFQRQRMGIAGPLGGHFSDYHGVIADPGVVWSAHDLLSACDLSIWNFNHLLANQEAFRPFHRELSESPIMDLRAGYDGYVEELRSRGSRQFQNLARKERKLGREVGEVRFEAHVPSPEILHQIVAWKKAQCEATGIVDVFTYPWTTALLERVLHVDTPQFAGLLSVLWAGDHMVAAHLGMRSSRVWHWWFPAYDHGFAKYSPGLIILNKLAQEAPQRGLEVIDLGKGADFYKNLFRNGAVPLAEGRVEVPSMSTTIVNFQERFEAWVRRSPFATAAKVPGRAIKRLARRTSLR